jgi:phosphatidylserine decarboxylase
MDVIRNPDGSLSIVDGIGYQFTQDRGLIIIETAIGMVAVLPIGMAQVSSVNLTPDLGANLRKGEEFGYFAFGGSDIITLFESNKVALTATVGHHYLQGQKLGHVLSSD